MDAVTPDIDTTVSGIKQAVGVGSGQPSSEEVANLGTTILGDNKVGRFVDEGSIQYVDGSDFDHHWGNISNNRNEE